jgi:hypothetical protein
MNTYSNMVFLFTYHIIQQTIAFKKLTKNIFQFTRWISAGRQHQHTFGWSSIIISAIHCSVRQEWNTAYQTCSNRRRPKYQHQLSCSIRRRPIINNHCEFVRKIFSTSCNIFLLFFKLQITLYDIRYISNKLLIFSWIFFIHI